MQSRHAELKDAGAALAAVSTSDPEDHARLARKIGASFPILSDPKGDAARAYGVLHPGALPFGDRPVARPAVFLLDGTGTVRKRFLTENWRIRERPERLLAELEGL